MAIVDILESFGWSYVSLLYSEGSYGTEGFRAIQNNMDSRGFCLAITVMIKRSFNSEDYQVSNSSHFISPSECNSTRDVAPFREEDRKTEKQEQKPRTKIQIATPL